MITLLTGQPGHGKTLRALQLALALKAEGREVYACRVTGLDFDKTGFRELEKMSDWQSLPDGSVVLVDECYEDIPARGPSKPVPEWIQKLATHRHRGFDFILVCQLGTQIDTFVRGLVDRHVHVRRKFGLNKSVLIEWDRYCGSVSSDAEIKSARHVAWSYPREVFEMYRSATMHTVKRSIPWQIIGIPLGILIIGGLIWLVFDRFSHRGIAERRAAEGAAPAATVPSVANRPQDVPLTPEAYAEKLRPRIAEMPWSAEVFDDRRVMAQPDVYCISTESLRCICQTEQGTPYSMDTRQCLRIARHGIYNPYRSPPAGTGRYWDSTPEGKSKDAVTARVEGESVYQVKSAGVSRGASGSRGLNDYDTTVFARR